MIVEDKSQSQFIMEPRAASKRHAWKPLHLVLLVVLVALLGALSLKVAASALTSAEIFAYPFQFDESEGMIVAETMLLDRGVNIFNPIGPDLFIAAPYPPLFYLLNWPIQHFAGPEPTFKGGRAISLLATLLAGVAIFGIVHALTKDKLAGALGATVWWSLPLVTFWGSLVKPDMLALTLGLCGLWLTVQSSRLKAQGSRLFSVWWALPFFLGAFFTKQTAIAAGVAAVAWLLLTRPRTGVAFGAAYGAGALIPSLLLNWWTEGGYYYHMITLHDLDWFLVRFTMHTGNLLATYGVFLIPGMAAIVLSVVHWLRERIRESKRNNPDDMDDQAQPPKGGFVTVAREFIRRAALSQSAPLLIFFYLVMTIVASVGTGTHGGNHNHMLEWVAASCLGVGLGAASIRRAKLRQMQAVGVVLGLLMLAWAPSLFSLPVWLKSEYAWLTERREGMGFIFQYVTNNGGTAYSDNVGLMLATGKKLWSTDPFTQTHATFYGRWDQSKLVDAIRRKHFAQIIMRIDVRRPDAGAGDVSPEILQAMRDSYKLDQENVENIYVPK